RGPAPLRAVRNQPEPFRRPPVLAELRGSGGVVAPPAARRMVALGRPADANQERLRGLPRNVPRSPEQDRDDLHELPAHGFGSVGGAQGGGRPADDRQRPPRLAASPHRLRPSGTTREDPPGPTLVCWITSEMLPSPHDPSPLPKYLGKF